MQVAQLLCSTSDNEFLGALQPGWAAMESAPLPGKLAFLEEAGYHISLKELLPDEPLSAGIDREDFAAAHLVQPYTFIRIRPGHRESVLQKLGAAGIDYKDISANTLAFDQKVDLGSTLDLDREAIIQDLSSQAVGDLVPELPSQSLVWDCCAASGGKSFLVADKLDSPILTVTDIRQFILKNLALRFERGGLKAARLQQMDLRDPGGIPGNAFDLVIADLPCTGSGTWGRTPEQLYFFRPSAVKEFSTLQKQISMNVLKALKKNGFFLYVTCSAFREENETNLAYLRGHAELLQIESRVITGYASGADTMFACLLQKT